VGSTVAPIYSDVPEGSEVVSHGHNFTDVPEGAQIVTPQSGPSTTAASAREGALGFFSGMGIPETQHPVKDLFSGALNQLGTMMGAKAWQGQDPYGVEALKATPPAAMASAGYGALKDIYGGGTRGGISPDTPQVAHGVGTLAGMGTGLKLADAFGGDDALKTKVSDAQKIINRHLAIDQGKVRVVNEMVRKPLDMLKSKINTEVGESVNSVLQADEADMMQKGNQVGFVDVSKAAQQARDAMGQTMKGLTEGSESQIIRAESRPMVPLREAKSFKTDVGTAAAALHRAGRYREAAAMDALYDGLNTATQDRASELGGQHGKLWQHYIAETRNYKTMQGGLLGELEDEPNHATALSKLIDPKRATESAEIGQALKKYGVDDSTFNKAKTLGVDLDKYANEAKMSFIGKIKAITEHPYGATPFIVGAAKLGAATHLPVMQFALPIIVAGRVSGLLDWNITKSLLKEIEMASTPEAGRVNPPLEGPMDKPSVAPLSGGSPPPTAPASPRGGPSPDEPPPSTRWKKGGINQKGVEESTKKSSLADQIQALRTTNYDLKERMRQAAGTSAFPDEEVQAAEKRMQENADLIKELQSKAKRKPSSKTGPVSWRVE